MKPEPTCTNLMERFGDRFKIGFDPAYDPKHRPKDKLAPWYLVIPCQRDEIYPHGGDTLIAEVEDRPITRNRLTSLDCTSVHQEGDHFAAFRFHVDDFDAVAEIVLPRKRRQVSEAEKERLRNLSAKHGFKSQPHQPEHGERNQWNRGVAASFLPCQRPNKRKSFRPSAFEGGGLFHPTSGSSYCPAASGQSYHQQVFHRH